MNAELLKAAKAILVDAMDRGDCYDENGKMYEDYANLEKAVKKAEPGIIVSVRGGMVQAVKSNVDYIKVQVLDYDNWKEETNKTQLDWYNEMEKEYKKLQFNHY